MSDSIRSETPENPDRPADDSPTPTIDSAITSVAGGSNIRILIVDDEKAITDVLSRFLTFEGYSVDVANDPYTALQKIHKENYLVIISDIAMPGMTGVELLRRIKAYNGMIQVIMMTGYVTLDNVLTCLCLGADDCFLKPIRNLTELENAVEEAVQKLRKWCKLMGDISRGEEHLT